MSTEADIVERIEAERTARAADPMRPANALLREAAAEITNLRADRDADRGNIRKLLSQQQELLEAILQMAKSAGLPAEMVADYEQQCQRSAAAIIATKENSHERVEAARLHDQRQAVCHEGSSRIRFHRIVRCCAEHQARHEGSSPGAG